MAEIIKECDNCKYVMTDTESFPCNRCKRNAVDKWEPMPKKTNADKIRSMSDEELADFLERIRKTGFNGLCCNNDLCDSDGCDCCMEEWLQSEAE